MLTPEAAKEALEKHKSKKHVEKRIARLAGLATPLHAQVRTLFQMDKEADETDSPWRHHRDRRRKSLAAYREMSEEAREEVIRTIMPDLAPYIFQAMKSFSRLPYGSGYGRKPFRAPSLSGVLDEHRMDFLFAVLSELEEYPPDVEWIATWAAHAWPYGGSFIGPLLAAAIDLDDAKGRKVFEILLASAKGEHEIGQMSRHLVYALAIAQRPEGWEFLEKLLLAAQREEGLRQAILESIDEGHPDAYTRFLGVSLEHDLFRFSAMVRAVDVWFGFLWDAMSTRKAKEIVEHARRFLTDSQVGDLAIEKAAALPARLVVKTKGKKLAEADEAVEPAYIALWTKAFNDVQSAFEPAGHLLAAANSEVRFVGLHLLGQLSLVGKHTDMIAQMLDDPDERVAARALAHFQGRHAGSDESIHPADLFERLERLLARAPEKGVKLAPIVWPWMAFQWSKEAAGQALVNALGSRPPTRLIPHLPSFDVRTRQLAAMKLGQSKEWDKATRDTLFFLVSDPSSAVRDHALNFLKKCTLAAEEAVGLEALLTRKAADLRRGVLILVVSQPDKAALASADRLLASKDLGQRVAGLEVLRQLTEGNREIEACRRRAEDYRKGHPETSADERTQLDVLLRPAVEELSFDNCLGLIDPAKRTKPRQPQRCAVEYVTPAAEAILASLDELIHMHREKPFTPVNRRGEVQEEVLLGNVRWEFPDVISDKPAHEQLDRLPFRDVWMQWHDSRDASMRDGDGLELYRAKWAIRANVTRGQKDAVHLPWMDEIQTRMRPRQPINLRYSTVVNGILEWMSALHPRTSDSWVLDGLENALAMIPSDQIAATKKARWGDDREIVWRSSDSAIKEFANRSTDVYKAADPEQRIRYFHLRRWMDEPGVAIERQRPGLAILMAAHQAGGAVDEDIYDFLLGPRKEGRYSGRNTELTTYCNLKPDDFVSKHPVLVPILHRCRDRVLEIELVRGETETLVSDICKHMGHTGGLDVLARFLAAAERDTFSRGHNWGSVSKPVVFSHIIRGTYPSESDTPAAFSEKLKGIPEKRLLELAAYAPQWVDHVAHLLGWQQLPEAVWWIYAHTRDRGWSVDHELRERWKAQTAQRTPLDAEDLLDGAVDVGWFKRTHEAMGPKRWAAVYEVAKYAASGGGHTRAQLFADAMLGEVKSKDLITRIDSKRHQDSVRALGLLPLPGDREKANKEILSRYRTLQEFVRSSRQFGSQRQASEKRAAAIGMENLARTAGFPDPIRLQWAMEAHACADLAKGPVTASVDEVQVTLSLDAHGAPEIACTKKGKPLASIPPAVKKNPKIQELTERKTELKRSSSRMRQSLEQAMIRGDVFSSGELRDLMANPILAPQLAGLVFLGEGIAGYPVDGGRGLMNYAGKIEPIKKGESLRLAHPRDFFDAKNWSEWQRDCFARERVQPFKQVFRELYVATRTELDTRNISRRYAGHQVQPRQALALLGGRGWVTAPEEGVFRRFHELGLTAWLTFQQTFFTPADIEGLTLEGVCFTKKSLGHGAMPLKDIPPRVFSEVMRDLDLVVSVAHRGGVDPEASASTIQMRGALLQETLSLLQLKNVRIKENHALIKGQLGEYSLHLGSAVTHMMPGGALFIVAVHSQHRGRLFLPFADDDPKTAEVLSKALLLARDSEIRDTNLLSQIRGQ